MECVRRDYKNTINQIVHTLILLCFMLFITQWCFLTCLFLCITSEAFFPSDYIENNTYTIDMKQKVK